MRNLEGSRDPKSTGIFSEAEVFNHVQQSRGVGEESNSHLTNGALGLHIPRYKLKCTSFSVIGSRSIV